MLDLYDEQLFEIYAITQLVQKRFEDKEDSLTNLNEMKNELEGRLYDAGYVARVEVGTVPVSVVIDDLVEYKEFDFEKKGWEVQKSRESGGI
jgi:hypothetical protein